jgi:hypothetical protein
LEDDIMIDPETDHMMTRAQEEAILAIRATDPAAARAHHNMAVRYSARAVISLVREQDIDPISTPALQAGRPARPE